MRKSLCQEVDLSVIIPSRNPEALLFSCLEKLVGQISSNDEILVVDNSVVHEAKNVLERFRFPSGQIRLLVEHRVGASFARNKGVAAACGRMIAFLDEDCWVSPTWAREIKKILKSDNDKRIFQGKIIHRVAQKNFLTDFFAYKNEDIWAKVRQTYQWKKYKTIDFINAGNFFVKRETLRPWWPEIFRAEAFPTVGEELELASRLQMAGISIHYVPAVSVTHTITDLNIPNALSRWWERGRAEGTLGQIHYAKLPKKKLFQEEISAFDGRRKQDSRFYRFIIRESKKDKLFVLKLFSYLLLSRTLYRLGKWVGGRRHKTMI